MSFERETNGIFVGRRAARRAAGEIAQEAGVRNNILPSLDRPRRLRYGAS